MNCNAMRLWRILPYRLHRKCLQNLPAKLHVVIWCENIGWCYMLACHMRGNGQEGTGRCPEGSRKFTIKTYHATVATRLIASVSSSGKHAASDSKLIWNVMETWHIDSFSREHWWMSTCYYEPCGRSLVCASISSAVQDERYA